MHNNKAITAKHNYLPQRIDYAAAGHYAAIDLGTNSCRLVIATPTPTSFHVVETFSKITRLGEGILMITRSHAMQFAAR